MDNLYLIFVINGTEDQSSLLEEFGRIKCKKKVALTREKINLSYAYQIKGWDFNSGRLMTDYHGMLGKRYYDQFDFYNFLRD